MVLVLVLAGLRVAPRRRAMVLVLAGLRVQPNVRDTRSKDGEGLIARRLSWQISLHKTFLHLVIRVAQVLPTLRRIC